MVVWGGVVSLGNPANNLWCGSWRHAGFRLRGNYTDMGAETGTDWGLLLTRKLGMPQLDSYDKKSNIIKGDY